MSTVTTDNTLFAVAGYVAAWTALAAYVLRQVMRWRALQQERRDLATVSAAEAPGG